MTASLARPTPPAGSDKPDASSPLTRLRLSDRVAAEVKRLVASGAFPPGTRLPSGQELAERFGVTRLTVREALQQLEVTGWTRTRHGAGTYVADLSAGATLQALAETLRAGRELAPGEIRHLLAFREVMVLGFADAVLAGASAEHVAQIDALVAAERRSLGDVPALAGLDYRFNELLATASGNLFYILLLGSLREAHVHLGQIVFRNCGDGSVVIDTHAAITAALRKRDAATFRRRLTKYLAGGNQIVEGSLTPRAGSSGSLAGKQEDP